MSEAPQKIAELVKSALELPPGERGTFLDQACAGDADLRNEAESFLQFQPEASQFIEQGALKVAAETIAGGSELPLTQQVESYQILSRIGVGGMGEVYLAQDTKLKRRVALKLVRAGMDSADLVSRFRHEERILASLNHPNIAQLFGAGIVAGDIPYFAMEYVEGRRIDEYCKANALSMRARLELFRKVCAAVHYAHQRLVIHRDLKPSNILVTADGEPKLLDFGIAKLIEGNDALTQMQTLVTGVMTPDYASPEQVRGEAMTTSTDVYSLGVLLYELLTGQRPYRLKTRSADEIARAITDQEPERPSTAAAKRAGNSKFEIRDSRFLQGDLDNIVLMALRKEPARRYASVGQFSEDIRRYLDGLPVLAHKDTVSYRAAKFLKRNKIGVAAVVLVILTLLGGIIATAWQAKRATTQARLADEQARSAAHERDRTRVEAAKAEAIKNFLERMLDSSNPLVTGKNNRETTVADVLEEAAKRLEGGEFSSELEIKAELEQIISRSYWAQGQYQQAQKHLHEVVSLLRQRYGERHPKTLVALTRWAQSLQFRNELAESENTYREILPLLREQKQKGNISAANLADAVNTFAFLRRTRGDSKEAESLFREALALTAQLSPSEWRLFNATTRSTLASTLADQGRFGEALQTSREAVEEFRLRGETGNPTFGFSLTILGGFLTENGDFVEAEATLQEGETILRKFLAPGNLWIGDNTRNQSILLYQKGEFAEALRQATEALSNYREGFGTHYDNYPTALIVSGLSLTKMGQSSEGEKILREALKIRTDSLPKEHYWVALANSSLGEALAFQKRYQEAEPFLRDGYESLRNSQGANNPRTRSALERLVGLYEAWGKPELAKAVADSFLSALRQ